MAAARPVSDVIREPQSVTSHLQASVVHTHYAHIYIMGLKELVLLPANYHWRVHQLQ